MKRFRVWMMMIGLLTMAATVNAQSLPPASVQSVTKQSIADLDYQPPVIAVGLQSADPSCQNACNPCWFSQAAQHATVALQRLRALCAGSNAACCETAQVTGVAKECCPAGVAKGLQVQVQTTGTGGLMLGQSVNSNNGIVGQIVLTGQPAPAAPCCGVKEMLQLTCPLGFGVAKTTTPCCCAKACACCETCKAKPATTANVPSLPVINWQIAPPLATWSYSNPSAPVPPAPVPPGARVVVGLPTSAPQANRPAHLVTPDLEAHCERMTHRGDTIVLEGNVLLLSKKHAQPVRIEGQRVLVNMKDGSFTVESVRAVTPVSFGVLRMSGVEFVMPETPAQRIIQVLPVPAR